MGFSGLSKKFGWILSTIFIISCTGTPPGVLQNTPLGSLVLSGSSVELVDADGNIVFGRVAVGESLTVVLSFRNTGEQVISAIQASLTGGLFQFTGGSFPGTGGNCPTLVKDAVCKVSITFTPDPEVTEDGESKIGLKVSFQQGATDKASLFEDYAAEHFTAEFSIAASYFLPPPTAAASLSIVSGSVFGFGTVAYGGTSQNTFTLSNDGTATATGISVGALTGGTGLSFPGGFPGGGTCGTTLAPGATCTFTLRWGLSEMPLLDETVAITYNDGASHTSVLALQVAGSRALPAMLTISALVSSNFDYVYVGTSKSLEFQISNIGGVAATDLVGDLSDAGFSFPGGFPGGGTCATSLAPTLTCTFVVEFNPVTTGPQMGFPSVQYGNGTGASPSASIALNGEGVAPGLLDSSHGVSGTFYYSVAGENDRVYASVAQADGKLVLVGSAVHTPYKDFFVARLTTDGQLDPTFDDPTVSTIPGVIFTTFGADAELFAVGLQEVAGETKIVAGGYVDGGSFGKDAVIIRYNLDGTLDTTFGAAGMQLIDLGGDEVIKSLLVQSDQKILVGGYIGFEEFKIMALARLTVEGEFDEGATGFGIAAPDRLGIMIVPPFMDEMEATSLAIDPANGDILVSGPARYESLTQFSIVRFDASGDPVYDFGLDAIVFQSVGPGRDVPTSLAIIPSGPDIGKILVGGYSYNGTDDDFALARFTSAGALDASFGTDGIVIDALTGRDRAHAMVLQADLKIVLGGNSEGDLALVRYLADGSRDTTFGTGGLTTTDVNLAGDLDFGRTLVLQADRLVLSGYTKFSGSSTQITSHRYWP